MSSTLFVDRQTAMRVAQVSYQTGSGWLYRGLMGPPSKATFDVAEVTALSLCGWLTRKGLRYDVLANVARWFASHGEETIFAHIAEGRRYLLIDLDAGDVCIADKSAFLFGGIVIDLPPALKRVAAAMIECVERKAAAKREKAVSKTEATAKT